MNKVNRSVVKFQVKQRQEAQRDKTQEKRQQKRTQPVDSRRGSGGPDNHHIAIQMGRQLP